MNRLCLWISIVVAFATSSAVAGDLRLTARQLLETATADNVTLAEGGAAIEIERGVIYEDDGPAAGYCYGPNEERLTGQVAVKKSLLIERPKAAKASLLVGPGGELTAQINGRAAALQLAGKSGQYWQQYEFDPAALVAGKNDIVLSGNGKVWIARDEDFAAGSRTQQRHPNRSAKSSDGGKTWTDARLGTADNLDGEYYVRVFLDQVRPRGSLTLDVLDSANLGGVPIAPAIKSVGPIRLTAKGTGDIALQIRSGTTFVPSAKTWTDWQPLAVLERPAGRYFQIRVDLTAKDPLMSPQLEELTIHSDAEASSTWQQSLKVVENRNAKMVRSAIAFEYEPLDHSRLKAFREQWQLDAVVVGAKTELELIGKLAFWSSQRWNKGHLSKVYPRWDASEILKTADDGTPVGGFCQQYNLVFLQACESFGFVGRAVSIGPGDSGLARGIRGGHEVVEIWSNQFAKWIYVDGNAAWYFIDEATGIPLSLMELRSRQLDAFEQTPAQGRTSIKRLAESKYEWTGLTTWPPFLELRLIPRSNFLEQAAPLPLHQGMRGWFWNGHHAWTDARSPAALLYGQRVTQPRNWNWTLNQAHVVLTATDKPGELQVELDTVTPSFADFRVQLDEQPPHATPATFLWKLHGGKNRLEVFPRSIAGRDGVRSLIVVEQ